MLTRDPETVPGGDRSVGGQVEIAASEGRRMWIAGLTRPPALTQTPAIQSQARFPQLSCAGDVIRSEKPPAASIPAGDFDSHNRLSDSIFCVFGAARVTTPLCLPEAFSRATQRAQCMILALALRSRARGRPRPNTFSRHLEALGRPRTAFGLIWVSHTLPCPPGWPLRASMDSLRTSASASVM